MTRREQLEEMLAADPDDTFVRYALALVYVSEGDSETGLQRLQEVIQRNPDYVAAYFQSGQILARESRIEEATKIVTTGIEVARRVGDSHAEAEMTAFREDL